MTSFAEEELEGGVSIFFFSASCFNFGNVKKKILGLWYVVCFGKMTEVEYFITYCITWNSDGYCVTQSSNLILILGSFTYLAGKNISL